MAGDCSAIENNEKQFLTCERDWVYFTLTFVAGFWGAYTYLLRGNIFCNAQTGNVVLMGMALGTGDWKLGLYYLIPISAYIFGAFVSELLPNPVKHHFSMRWDTLLILVEIVVVAVLGFLPETAPVQIAQVSINFIASMQYNTFRQAESIPVATTFVTNHVRQIGVGLAKEVRHRHDAEKPFRHRLSIHAIMLFFFSIGAIVGAFFGDMILGKAIWITIIPLVIIFLTLLHADLTTEKDMVDKKPSGH